MTLVPLSVAVVATTTDTHVGIASGVNSALARVGNLAIVVVPLLAGLSGGDFTDPDAFGGGLGRGMWWCAGLLGCAALAAFGLPGRRDVERLHLRARWWRTATTPLPGRLRWRCHCISSRRRVESGRCDIQVASLALGSTSVSICVSRTRSARPRAADSSSARVTASRSMRARAANGR